VLWWIYSQVTANVPFIQCFALSNAEQYPLILLAWYYQQMNARALAKHQAEHVLRGNPGVSVGFSKRLEQNQKKIVELEYVQKRLWKLIDGTEEAYPGELDDLAHKFTPEIPAQTIRVGGLVFTWPAVGFISGIETGWELADSTCGHVELEQSRLTRVQIAIKQLLVRQQALFVRAQQIKALLTARFAIVLRNIQRVLAVVRVRHAVVIVAPSPLQQRPTASPNSPSASI
jgi:hypothetical protein